jgi:hypothetical protein
MLPAGSQRRQHGANVVVKKQHRRDDDVGLRDVRQAGRERRVIGAPFVGRVQHQLETRKLVPQCPLSARQCAGKMAVQRYDDDAQGRRISG